MEMKALQRRGMSAEMAKMQYEPFKTNYITLFNSTSNYLIFMWPAMMAVVLLQVILLAMAVSFAEDSEIQVHSIKNHNIENRKNPNRERFYQHH
jgi:hypothetical protein